MQDVELNALKDGWMGILDSVCSKGFSQFFEKRNEPIYANSTWDCETINEVNFKCGASKMVLITEEINWVLKIPFIDKKCDYCKLEVEYYKKSS